MTGLETISEQPLVRRYLRAHGLQPQPLMPDWPGWDKPHLLSMQSGGIVPTSVELLWADVERWYRTGNAYHVSLAP